MGIWKVSGGFLHDGIRNVAGGVLQVGFLKMGIWKFAGGILLVRFLM